MAQYDFDLLIVGGGHAGAEAARMANRMMMKIGLITMDPAKLALMSCNPAVGGVGKGHLVREADALGGIIGLATDFAGIQFRRLNLSKGPAVHSTRVQCDRRKYCEFVSRFVASLPDVQIIQDEVIGLIAEGGQIKGLTLKAHGILFARAVILATGTFLGGLMHIGRQQIPGGRRDEPAAVGLTESLRKAGFQTGRLKTGTPPRIDGLTIDYSRVEPQQGDNPAPYFSHFHALKPGLNNGSLCHLTYTTEATAQIIRDNLHQAPLFSGQIKGIGPRYCPSIEDKVVRFTDKPRHQLFIEPEGNGTDEIYLNGFATSIPEDIQSKAVRTVVGLENAVITKPGYAVEYDFVPPFQIKSSLETKLIPGLFHAGQINGTSGYEEAAAQGLIAGLNASLYIRGEPPFVPGRQESYVGVMLDDLVTKNISEPYRMFTSRAEYRLALREDNALDRLSPYGKRYGLYTSDEIAMIDRRENDIAEVAGYLKTTRINSKVIRQRFGLITKRGSLSLADLVCRPDFDPMQVLELSDNRLPDRLDAFIKTVILLKYKGYLKKQDREIEHRKKNDNQSIPERLDYRALSGLKKEAVEKLDRFRPETIGQAGRIEGVTPADVAILTIYLGKRGNLAGNLINEPR